MPKKTLIIGCNSFLGSKLYDTFAHFFPGTIGTHYNHENPSLRVNLLNPSLELLDLKENDYEYAIIAAANTNLTACEQEKELPFRKNVEGVLNLCRLLIAKNITPIMFSTDYVFDGVQGGYSENSPTNPLNEYGRQKVEVEKQIKEICGNQYLLIRCSKVFGLTLGDYSLIDQIVSPLLCDQEVLAATDQVFSPIYIEDVVRAIIQLQNKACTGLFNLCGPVVLTRFELANQIADKLALNKNLIKKIFLDDLERTYALPKKTYMNCDKFYSATGMALTSLDQCLEILKNSLTSQIEAT